MKTRFPYGKIDFQKYFDDYQQREDAVQTLPSEEELRELARKGIVREQLVLSSVEPGEAAKEGDTLTLAVSSPLPKFNKERVKVTIGRGLYDKDLEAALVGLKQGEHCRVFIKETPVSAEILEIRRKTEPTPTDEMVKALAVKDFKGNPIETVEAYENFVMEERTSEAVSEVSYYMMEAIIKDYPVEHYEESDIARLGQLEQEFYEKIFLEQKGVDLSALSEEQFREELGVANMDEFLNMRHDWYQMKIHQCLILLNVLNLPCEGKTDPLDHYEVLSELTELFQQKIIEKLSDRRGQ